MRYSIEIYIVNDGNQLNWTATTTTPTKNSAKTSEIYSNYLFSKHFEENWRDKKMENENLLHIPHRHPSNNTIYDPSDENIDVSIVDEISIFVS